MRSINEKINESKISRDRLLDKIYSYMDNMDHNEFCDMLLDMLTDDQLEEFADGLDRMI